MEGANLKEVECPICLETLRKPIRMLECGHNFCHQCIESYCCPGQQNRCPSCRNRISANTNQIPRNFTLENLIENLSKVNAAAFKPATSATDILSDNALEQLGDTAVQAYMDAKEYSKAFQTLQNLIPQKKGVSQLLTMMKKIKCQIELGEDATVTCVEVASILSEPNLQDPPTEKVDQLDDEIHFFVKHFIETNLNTALLFQRCRFDLIKIFYKTEAKLNKLTSIGEDMQSLMDEMKKQNIAGRFKQQYSFMDVILDEMQSIAITDVKFKCINVAWMVKCYSNCCSQLSDFEKSIELAGKGIFMMETVLGGETTFQKTFYLLYSILGFAYENLDNLVKAKQCFEKLKFMCFQVKNFESKVERKKSISLSTESLRRVESKLQNAQRPVKLTSKKGHVAQSPARKSQLRPRNGESPSPSNSSSSVGQQLW